MSDAVPFGCGTQYADWQEANCFQCGKYTFFPERDEERCDCEIFWAYTAAQFGEPIPDGTNARAGRHCKEKV